MIHLSKDPAQSLVDALPLRRDPRLSRRARHAARIERRKGLRLFVQGKHDAASASFRLARRYEEVANGQGLEGWAVSDSALQARPITHADLQKAMPGLSIETITQLEKRVLEKWPDLSERGLTGESQIIEPAPEDERGVLQGTINESEDGESETRRDSSSISRPSEVPLLTGQFGELAHPSSAHHPS